MKELIIVIMGVLTGLIIAFGLLGLIWWGIGSLIVWAFGINFTWTFWHGLVVAIVLYATSGIFTVNIKKEN